MRKTLEIMTLLVALLFSSNKVKAEELTRKQPQTIERTLREGISKPKIDINFNYKTESKQKVIDYKMSETTLWTGWGYPLWRESDTPKLSEIEKQEVKDILKDIKNEEINSYQELVEAGKNLLLQNQKLDLLATIGGSLGKFNYENSNMKVTSQEEFFDKFQDSLESGKKNGLGNCRHIHSYIEQLANDLGIKSAAVSGISENGLGHIYDILKVEDGTAIIDYSNLLIMPTKNIEKALQIYQKNMGTIVFEHSFFEDTEFKYRLITKDGKNLRDFMEYDSSSESLKNALIEEITPQANLVINFNIEDFLTSVEGNLFGFFLKAGEIRGDSDSPLEKITLIQAGFKRNFSTPKIIDIKSDVSLIEGNISQDTKFKDNKILGIKGNLILSTNNKKGFNFSSRIAGNTFISSLIFGYTKNFLSSGVFSDFILGGGVSYKIPIKDINVKPYATSQFALFPEDIGTYKYMPKLSELTAGTVFNFKIPDKFSLSLEPYYLKRIWEQKFGGKIELENKHIGINAEGYITKSNYEFCPDKYGFDIGSYLNLKNLTFKVKYKIDNVNYDGEIENQQALDIGTSIKF